MEKYLFNDGTNVIREVQSKEELHELVQAGGDTGAIRVWIYNSSEWLTWSDFIKRFPLKAVPVKQAPVKSISSVRAGNAQPVSVPLQKVDRQFSWFKRAGILLLSVGAIFLVYNFTRISWTKASPLYVTAERPENVPVIDVDSLIQVLELARNQKLEKVTRTNLRIRSTWPDRIVLSLKSEKDSSSAGGIRFHDTEINIDNSTGYMLDNAVVLLTAWKNNERIGTDTIKFKNINYASPSKELVNKEIKADSLSVSFSSIKGSAFYFCYSMDKQSNYGNLNDRWFCRD